MLGRWHGKVGWWRRFAGESRAAAATEYAVLLALIAITVVAAAAILGNGVRDGTHSISTGLAGTGSDLVVHTAPHGQP